MQELIFNWKITALVKPEILGEDYLVYNSCDGFRIAEWNEIMGEYGFYEFGEVTPLSMDIAFFWCELPSLKEMTKMIHGLSNHPTIARQLVSVDRPLILVQP